MCNIGRLKFDAVPLVLYALLRRGYRYYQLGSSNDVNLRYPILLTVMSDSRGQYLCPLVTPNKSNRVSRVDKSLKFT
jgi:hypothetical protein